ncbi:MAG: hypothetical protein ACE5R6_08625 [Candidatus Heimdallarchaeota archaeon]
MEIQHGQAPGSHDYLVTRSPACPSAGAQPIPDALEYVDWLFTVVEAFKEWVFKHSTVPYKEAVIPTNHYMGDLLCKTPSMLGSVR